MIRTFLFVGTLIAGLLLLGNCNNKSTIAISSHVNQLADSLRTFVQYDSKIIALTHARLIDGSGAPVKQEQTIIVEDGYFKTIGNSADIPIPKNATVIDLKGKTIIPGIIGMHNHLHIPRFPYVGDVAARLYLAAGVTTIQTCGAASPDRELDLARRIAAKEQIGPDIIASAPFITGEGGNPNMVLPRDEQHLRDTMQHWIRQGVKWFKVYRNTSPDDLKIIINEAHKVGGKVRGHLCSITFEEAALMGIDGIEHGLNSTSDFRTDKTYGVCNGGRAYMDQLIIDSPEVRALQQTMIDQNVFLTSTLAIYEASIPNRAFVDQRAFRAMSPFLQDQYTQNRKRHDEAPTDSTRNKRLKRIMEFEYQYHQMGGLLCSGVDAGRHVLPGFGDQRNYQLHLESGFSAEEAIRIMTANGAKALERTDIGLIQIGKRADFVILSGDLVKDTTTIEKVETVFKQGIGFDPQKILNTTEGKFGIE